MNGQGFNNPPVQAGEELDVKIEAVGAKGDGIAKKDGFVLFVPGVKEGDNVRIKVTKVLSKAGFAEVVGSAEKKPEQEKVKVEQEAPVEAPVEQEVQDTSQDTESFGEELEEDKYKISYFFILFFSIIYK